MGFRVLLIRILGKSPATIHEEYGVIPTEEFEELPESPVAGAVMPQGGYLLYINDWIVPDDRVFAKLSLGATLAACYVNETVGDSFACNWSKGIEQWTAHHDSHQSSEHLEVTGQLPPEFPEIRDRLFDLRKDESQVDYVFDVPVELFVAMGGIHYSEDIPGAGPKPWQVLVRPRPKSRWWWPF